MTVASTTVQTKAAGNGVATVFAYQFKIEEASDLLVEVIDSSGNITTLVLNSDYTVDPLGVGLDAGGNITYSPSAGPLASGNTLVMSRIMPLTQGTNLRNQGTYLPEVVEDELDRLAMVDMQHDFTLQRTVRAELTDGALSALPSAASRAGKFLTFDSNGDVLPLALSVTPTVLNSVDTYAALRLVSGSTDGEQIGVGGATASGDGGAGTFIWNAASVAADNGGTIIAPTGVATGRWYRQYFGSIIASEWFGVMPSATAANNTTGITNALALLGTMGGGTLKFPAGTILHNGGFNVPTLTVLAGAGSQATTLSDQGTGVSFTFNGASYSSYLYCVTVQDIEFTSSTATTAISTTYSSELIFRNLQFIGYTNHIIFGASSTSTSDFSPNVTIKDCYFYQGTNQIYFGGSSNLLIERCNFDAYSGVGVLIEDSSTIQIRNCVGGSTSASATNYILIRSSTLNNANANALSNIKIDGVEMENMPSGNCIGITGSGTTIIHDVTLTHISNHPSTLPFLVASGYVEDVFIYDNLINTAPGSATPITLGANCARVHIGPNDWNSNVPTISDAANCVLDVQAGYWSAIGSVASIPSGTGSGSLTFSGTSAPVLPKNVRLVAMSAHLDAVITAGTLTVTAVIAGSIKLTLTLTAGSGNNYATTCAQPVYDLTAGGIGTSLSTFGANYSSSSTYAPAGGNLTVVLIFA